MQNSSKSTNFCSMISAHSSNSYSLAIKSSTTNPSTSRSNSTTSVANATKHSSCLTQSFSSVFIVTRPCVTRSWTGSPRRNSISTNSSRARLVQCTPNTTGSTRNVWRQSGGTNQSKMNIHVSKPPSPSRMTPWVRWRDRSTEIFKKSISSPKFWRDSFSTSKPGKMWTSSLTSQAPLPNVS